MPLDTNNCYWLHCNYCAQLPAPDIAYFLANCGHVSCSKCVTKKIPTPVCNKCKRRTNIIQIGDDMKDSLKVFFSSLPNEYENLIKSVKKSIDFQMKNYKNLIVHKNKKIRELESQNNINDRQRLEILKKEKEKLELEYAALISQTETVCPTPRTQHVQSNMLNTTRNLLAGTASIDVSSSSFLNGMTAYDGTKQHNTSMASNVSMENVGVNQTIEVNNPYAAFKLNYDIYQEKKKNLDRTL